MQDVRIFKMLLSVNGPFQDVPARTGKRFRRAADLGWKGRFTGHCPWSERALAVGSLCLEITEKEPHFS